jgi:NitT/TauT family transport system permease protein
VRVFIARYALLAALVGLWEGVVLLQWVDAAFLPSPHAIGAALIELATGRELWVNLAVSVWRSLAGLVLGSLAGVAIGLAMALSRRAEGFLGPLVAATYSLPKAALVPLFILWFGIGDLSAILAVFLACLLPVIVSTFQGVKSVPEVLLWSARALGTRPSVMMWRVVLPAASLSILAGIRIALAFSWVLTLSTEMIAARLGIGKFVFLFGESGSYAYMFAGISAILVVAFAADRLLLRAMHRLLHWDESAVSAQVLA